MDTTQSNAPTGSRDSKVEDAILKLLRSSGPQTLQEILIKTRVPSERFSNEMLFLISEGKVRPLATDSTRFEAVLIAEETLTALTPGDAILKLLRSSGPAQTLQAILVKTRVPSERFSNGMLFLISEGKVRPLATDSTRFEATVAPDGFDLEKAILEVMALMPGEPLTPNQVRVIAGMRLLELSRVYETFLRSLCTET